MDQEDLEELMRQGEEELHGMEVDDEMQMLLESRYFLVKMFFLFYFLNCFSCLFSGWLCVRGRIYRVLHCVVH